MRRDHHALPRSKIEGIGGGKINPGIWLVITGKLRPENCVPRKTIAPGQIHHDGNIAIRQRRQKVPALKPGEPACYVRPGVEAMPRQIKLTKLLFAQTGDFEIWQDAFKILAMQDV